MPSNSGINNKCNTESEGEKMILYYFPLVLVFLAVIVSIRYRTAGYIVTAFASFIFFLFTFKIFDYITYFYLIAAIVWIITSVFSISYSKKYGKWLAPLFILTIAGMMLILYSSNFLLFITGWEIMSIPAYLTVAVNRKNDIEAYVFMFFSEISTVLIIAAAVISYYYTGTFAFTGLANDTVLLIFALGAMSKMGLTPFMISEWLPIAHGSAPANSSAIFSATMTLMGVYGIVKIALLSVVSVDIGIIFIIIGVISVLFGALYAYISENMKSLGGFSTIENNGAIMATIGLFVAVDNTVLREFILISIAIFAMAHSIGKTGLFITIGHTGVEYFSAVTEGKSTINQIGKFFALSSLSGLFPSLGGLGTWMILESFFMGAYLYGPLGITSIIAGSLIAMGEGFATAAMLKIFYFTDNHKQSSGKNLENYTILATGLTLVILFAISFLIIGKEYISGIPSVLVFNGLMIESRFGPSDFGLITPLYIFAFLILFSLVVYFVFGKPKVRVARRWNGGVDDDEHYNSFTYSNNIRLILKRILRTSYTNEHQVETVDIFWFAMINIARTYRKFAKFVAYKIMNSSISAYIIYMIFAFILVIIIVSIA
ncbi:proton-conducting transporter membrane subunit [Ferroplasma sp.]|uniref:proton-conducting transporter transmembrane domain-containing protein n=1 Tax=Ferroplasma sp. TaxID=2591003 RepID=UPI00307ED046